jgi:hypothetical protein
MKRITVGVITIAILIVSGLTIAAHAQDKPGNDTRLSVPWDEFKKLVNLDEDEIVISLETFQKLLAQTGARTTPTHVLKDGNVVMSREEFKKLVDQMKPPQAADATPPFDHLITKAMYSGEMKDNSTVFTAVFNVHVLKKGAYVRVPILPRQIALADMTVDGEPALVVVENGYHSIVLPSAGEYEVVASYSLKSSLDKGPHKIDLAIQQTPITLLTLEMPITDIDVEIPQAQQVLTGERDDKTVVSAVIGEGTAISVRWRKQVAAADKVPAKLYDRHRRGCRRMAGDNARGPAHTSHSFYIWKKGSGRGDRHNGNYVFGIEARQRLFRDTDTRYRPRDRFHRDRARHQRRGDCNGKRRARESCRPEAPASLDQQVGETADHGFQISEAPLQSGF